MAFQARNIVEVFLWISLGIAGIAWIMYIMNMVIKDENPLTAIRGDIDLSDVDYPAITICSEQTTKYAFAERLGNYFDPELELPDPLKKLQKRFFDKMLTTQYPYGYDRLCNMGGYKYRNICQVAFCYSKKPLQTQIFIHQHYF